MRKLLCSLVISVACLSSVHAEEIIRNATIITAGTQDGVDSSEADIFWIQLNKTMGPSACHTANLDIVVFDLSKSVSKAAMSLALTAYTTGKTVDIDTYAECVSGWSTVRNIYFSPNQ